MDESDLIRKAQEGDQDAYADLFGRYLPRIKNTAEKILGNEADAEEIAPDVFMRGIETYDRGKGARFDTWLLGKLTTNACLSRIRRTNAKKLMGRDEGDDEKLTAKPTALPDHNVDDEETLRYWKVEGGPSVKERDGLLTDYMAEEHREKFLSAAKEKIKKWGNTAHRENGLRIVGDPRIVKFLNTLSVDAQARVGINQFLRAVEICAECSEPKKEPFTPEDARGAVKTLEFYGRHFHRAPAGSGFEAMSANIEMLLPLIRRVANRKGTKTVPHQYDCILGLDALRGIDRSRRRPTTAIRLLLEITYGEPWTEKKLADYRRRARKAM